MSDLGWGSDAEPSAWGNGGSAVLVVTLGMYWLAQWLVGGLASVPFLVSRAHRDGSASKERS